METENKPKELLKNKIIKQLESGEPSIDGDIRLEFAAAILIHKNPEINSLVDKCVKIAQQHAKETVINILNWLTKEDSPYAILYGNQAERFVTNDEDLTSEQLYQKYLKSKA